MTDRAARAANIAAMLEREREERRQAAQRPATVRELAELRRDLARLAAVADCGHGDAVLRLERAVEQLQAEFAELVGALEDGGAIAVLSRGGIVGRGRAA